VVEHLTHRRKVKGSSQAFVPRTERENAPKSFTTTAALTFDATGEPFL